MHIQRDKQKVDCRRQLSQVQENSGLISDSIAIRLADDRSFGESLGDRLFSYGLRFYVTR